MEESAKAHEGTAELGGASILVVEDDFLILMELESVLSAAGADVIGPSRNVEEALMLAGEQGITAAILDVRIGRDTVAPVARRLSARRIPFLFYTGQVGTDPIWQEWPAARVLSKPATPQVLVSAVAALLREVDRSGLAAVREAGGVPDTR
jgi:DNA-binding response OmpR family regulator